MSVYKVWRPVPPPDPAAVNAVPTVADYDRGTVTSADWVIPADWEHADTGMTRTEWLAAGNPERDDCAWQPPG